MNMQVSDPMDQENIQIIRDIKVKIQDSELNKHQQIRIKQWLKKLQQPIQNKVWKQNRNLYMKALKQMVIYSILQEPFTSLPPEGPLKKLSIYDISASIRDKIGNIQSKQHQSRRNSINGFLSTKKQLSFPKKQQGKHNKMIQSVNPNQFSFGSNQLLNSIKINNGTDQNKLKGLENTLRKKSEQKMPNSNNKFWKHNRKISCDFDRVDTFRKNLQGKEYQNKKKFIKDQYVCKNVFSKQMMNEDFENSISQISSKTYRNQTNESYFHDLYFAQNDNLHQYQDSKQYKINITNNIESQKSQQSHQEQLKVDLGLQILRQCLVFMGSNYELLNKFPNYGQILEKIVKTGDKFNQNFREVQINTQEQQHEAIQKKFLEYSHKIRQRLVSTDIQTQKFMSYLQTINN